MDVFVVVEDNSVIGVGMTLADAEEIADRAGYEGAEAWRDWRYGSGKQFRTREAPTGPFTYEGRQEIVSAPLAGYARRIPEPIIDESVTMRAIAPVVAGQPVRYGEEVHEIGRTWGAP